MASFFFSILSVIIKWCFINFKIYFLKKHFNISNIMMCFQRDGILYFTINAFSIRLHTKICHCMMEGVFNMMKYSNNSHLLSI